MKWLGRIVVAGLLAFAVWWLWQRVFVTDEMRIKRQIGAMARAVEKGELLKLSDAIAYDYADLLFAFSPYAIIWHSTSPL